jgi:plasmid segregation protein ParM
MTAVVRAIDVGFGYTKFTTGGSGGGIRWASLSSLARLSTRDPAASLGADRRRTFAVPIKSVFCEVGRDVTLAGDGFRAPQIPSLRTRLRS